MEVTRTNFNELIPEIDSAISSAVFLSIDGEFTGLHTGKDVTAFDTPEEYYRKLKDGGMDFLLVQFGLCSFHYDREKNKFTHQAFNFYVFPKPHARYAVDRRFLCQSSSLEFLASQGFDFNKLFKDGIPYVTPAEEQILRDRLEEVQKSREHEQSLLTSPGNGEAAPLITIPDEYISVIDDICTRIEKFLESSEESLELDRCNAFVRKLVYQRVQLKFPTVHLESKTTENRNRIIVVTKADKAIKKQREQEKKRSEQEALDSAVGFSVVIRKITESGKLVIGHNMVLDICHIVHQFCTPLPDDYIEFKEIVRCVFPRVLDTKLMSSTHPFKDKIPSTVLSHLLKIVSEDPFEAPDVAPAKSNKGYCTAKDKSHEAGYDAYITGLCFIAMSNYLGTFQNPCINPVLPDSPLLKPFVNKLFLMRIQDIPYINLSGEDSNPPRDHVFHVTFPKEWKTYDLTQLFSPFGGVFIGWLTDTTAFVALNKRDQAKIVLRTLTQNDRYTVVPYHQFMQKARVQPAPLVKTPPPSNTKKRKSLEQEAPTKPKKSRSFGESSFSKRGIEPILEEQEEEPMNSSAHETKAANGENKRKVFEEDHTWD